MLILRLVVGSKPPADGLFEPYPLISCCALAEWAQPARCDDTPFANAQEAKAWRDTRLPQPGWGGLSH